jgi:hypothetical protein
MIKFLPDDKQLSPKQIDYLIDAYTGIIGDIILPATTRGQGAFSVIGRQFTADPLYSNQTVVDFYDYLEKAQQKAADKNILQGIPAKELTLEEKKKNAMTKASEEMSALTKLAIKANIGTLSADEKKALKDDYGIDANAENLQETLRAKRIEIAEKANRLYATGTEMDFDLARSEPISETVQKYQAAGFSQDKAYSIYKTIDALEPLAGKDAVQESQKIDAVLSMSLNESDKLKALSVCASESQYKRYATANKYGVAVKTYNSFYKALKALDENGSVTKEEATQAVSKMTGLTDVQRAALWAMSVGSNVKTGNPWGNIYASNGTLKWAA